MNEIEPYQITAYALAVGWQQKDPYGPSSMIYEADDLPEIIVPLTNEIGDYDSVTKRLIRIFAEATGDSHNTVRQDVKTALRDAIRLRVPEGGVSVPMTIQQDAKMRDQVVMLLDSVMSCQHKDMGTAEARNTHDTLQRLETWGMEREECILTLVGPELPYPDEQLDRSISPRQAIVDLQGCLTEIRDNPGGMGDWANTAEYIEERTRHKYTARRALKQLIRQLGEIEFEITWAKSRPTGSARSKIRFGKSHLSEITRRTEG